MTTPHCVAAVVLTYNSAHDLPQCLAGLITQRGVDLRIVVVDNASREIELTQMKADFLEALPEGILLSAGSSTLISTRAAFVTNDRNIGYSGGNNIGARLGVEMGCEALLIVNPDVRITDPYYVKKLAELLFSMPQAAMAGSAMHNLKGGNENPMRNMSFLEEVLWPVKMLLSGFGLRRHPVPSTQHSRCTTVSQLSGCCFLIRTDILQEIGFFDDKVFLYCEEAILAAQMRARHRTMIYTDDVQALHAHDTNVKGNAYRRFAEWSRSRRYFHRVYSGYGPLRCVLLQLSRTVILLLIKAKTVLTRQNQ